LVLSAMFNLPPSFFIVGIAFVVWVGVHIADRGISRRRPLRSREARRATRRAADEQ
jgi:hypothetical protein